MIKDKRKALFIAHKLFAELVFDMAKLEGLPFTMPEVQTYLQGVTVGGHKVSAVEKLRRLKLSWELLIELVKKDEFSPTLETACTIQKVIGHGEAIPLDAHRTDQVNTARTGYRPLQSGEPNELFSSMLHDMLKFKDVREQAYRLYLDFARNQFFSGGNRGTGLLMANGHLISNGYPPLSFPAKRLTEYNDAMVRFYESDGYEEMMTFLKECHETMYGRFK